MQSNFLVPDFLAIFNRLQQLGSVKASHYSFSSSHQVTGLFVKLRNRNRLIMQFNPNIDVRLFTAKWRAVALQKISPDQSSLVFFDRFGDICYRVETLDSDQTDLLESWRQEFCLPDTQVPKFKKPSAPAKHRRKVDENQLRAEWLAMTNVHQAIRLFKKYANDAQAVYRMLGQDLAKPLKVENLSGFFKLLFDEAYPLMMFARNDSAVQCYSGCIHSIALRPESLSLKGQDFASELDLTKIETLWLVRKPTSIGWVYSLNLFDSQGKEAWVLTDLRLQGQAERVDWLSHIQQAFEIS